MLVICSFTVSGSSWRVSHVGWISCVCSGLSASVVWSCLGTGTKGATTLTDQSALGFVAVIAGFPHLKEKKDALYFWRHFPVKMSPGCLTELRCL